MTFIDCIESKKSILMEGALGERLKREYNLKFDADVDMAGFVYSEEGRTALRNLWNEYAVIAKTYHLPFLATTPTRRANQERVKSSCFHASIIKDNVAFLRSVQKENDPEMYVGGLMGCRGDAYTGVGCLSTQDALDFHSWEISLFKQAGVDFLYAALIPSLDEAAGIALAIQKAKIPYIISFTIQKNGCLVDGTPISEAVQYIDHTVEIPPVCYMTNCVHPNIVYEALSNPINNCELIRKRFIGIQANTAALSFAELDGSKELKTSDPAELAEAMLKLREIVPFKIFGGCCGTDGRHMIEIAKRISPMWD